MPIPIISLTTDLGASSYFVGAIKGVIMSINPAAHIVDITHDIPPFDILQASFVLEAASKYFPVPSIHVVVVDPGVGSSRMPLLAACEKHYYLLPDNGVITRVSESDPVSQIFAVEEQHYMLPRTSETFHGRDVFAPVAAWLSKSFNATLFGDQVESYKTIDIPKPKFIKENIAECRVLFADRFGNIVTCMDREFFDQATEKFNNAQVKVKIGNLVIDGIKTHYFQVPNQNDPLALFGSMDMLEISIREGNAQKMLNVNLGDPVYLMWKE